MLTRAEYADIHATLAFHLELIAHRFRPGVRLTLVVRQPDNPDGTTYLSSDNPDEVIAAINDVRARAAFVAGPAEPERDDAKGGSRG